MLIANAPRLNRALEVGILVTVSYFALYAIFDMFWSGPSEWAAALFAAVLPGWRNWIEWLYISFLSFLLILVTTVYKFFEFFQFDPSASWDRLITLIG